MKKKTTKRGNVRVSIPMPQDERTQLRATARARKCSASQYVQTLIERDLATR